MHPPRRTPWPVLPALLIGLGGVGASPVAARDQAQEAALREAITRRTAPELRFNAYVEGDDSLQNRNEDFFPMSVRGFLESLVSGRYRLVIRRSDARQPAVVRTMPQRPRGVIGREAMDGFPEEMAGDPPGLAPVYVHAYPQPGSARETKGGGVIEEWAVEYWLFYPYDWTCSRALGQMGCAGAHRGDWEHTAYRVATRVGPGGQLQDLRLLEGFYYAHEWGIRVPRAAIETVADPGEPGSAHPVVYISAGKHGSYPEAGELRDFAAVWVLSDHDDFFRGNGVRVRSWKGRLVDLTPALAGKPGPELAPGALKTLLQRPGSDAPALRSWVDYRGRWGPEHKGALGVYWADSATGPIRKRSFGRPERGTLPYEEWKQRYREKLVLYRAEGRPNPRVVPPPAPVEPARR